MECDKTTDQATRDPPVILVVNANLEDRAAAEETLLRRFAPDYQVLTDSHDLRDTIARNTIPFGFYPLDFEAGQRLVRKYAVNTDRLPALILNNGSALHQQRRLNIANVLGIDVHPSPERYDLAILGAGPAGLAAAVYGASEGLRTVIIEPHAIGGQAGTSSMIRNCPGFPFFSGRSSCGRRSARAWSAARRCRAGISCLKSCPRRLRRPWRSSLPSGLSAECVHTGLL